MSAGRENQRLEAVAFDIDGTLLAGDTVLPDAPETVAALAAAGLHVLYVTNTSGRTRSQTVAVLGKAGFAARESDIYTSSAATAAWLARHEVPSAAVLGTDGLREEIAGAGVRVVEQDDEFASLVIGLDRSYDFTCTRPLTAEAQRRLAADHIPIVACNRDASYPGPDARPRPGCGALVALVERQCGRRATAAIGKPEPDMLLQAAADFGLDPRSILVVGDSVASDIAMAQAAEAPWALVPEPRSGHPQLEALALAKETRGIILERLADLPLML